VSAFLALTTGVTVDIDDAFVDAELVRALICSYPPAESSELHYELAPNRLVRNGERMDLDDPRDIVPRFEIDLYGQCVARAAPGWVLHAAALAVNGGALVLCGASGAGKTTLTLALTARGFRMLTEEIVWIDRAGSVRGLPRVMHLPPGAKRERVTNPWRTLPYRMVTRDGQLTETTIMVPPQSVWHHGSLPLRALVRMDHGPDWHRHLRTVPRHVALRRLWDGSMRHDDSGLEAAVEVLREHGSFELASTTEQEALDLLEPLLK